VRTTHIVAVRRQMVNVKNCRKEVGFEYMILMTVLIATSLL